MRLELPVRWNERAPNEQTDNELEKLKGDTEPKYTYGKLSIDSEDIGPYYEIDDRHTMVNDKLGKLYCVAVPFHEFKRVYTEVSGKAILAIQTTEEYKSNRASRKKKPDEPKDDTDGILGD